MIEIRKVQTKADMRAFIDVGYKLYENCAQAVPDLEEDVRYTLDPQHNPCLEFCESEAYLAYKDERAVGRVMAIHNRAANERWNQAAVRFWMLDFEEDLEILRALMNAVEAFAKARGCDTVHGPLGFSDMDKQGMLVKGFEEQDLFITIYNYAYYPQMLEQLGYGKEYDWVEYQIQVNDDMPMERMQRISDVVLRRNKLKRLEIDKMSTALPYKYQVFDLVNTTYKDLAGFVPFTRATADKYAEEFLKWLNSDYIQLVLDKDDRLVGLGLAMPAIGPAVKKSKGKLNPLGLVRMLRAMKHNTQVDMLLVAVHPDFQASGLLAVILHGFMKVALKNGVTLAETGPELELNEKVQSIWDDFRARQHRTRRCYIKTLENSERA